MKLIVTGGAGFGDSRPADEEGLPDASFIEPALARAEGKVGGGGTFGGGEAAVVGEKDDQRVVVDPSCFETEVFGLLLVFLDEVRTADERGVDGVEGKVCEEGFVLVVCDEFGGFGGEAVGEVFSIWSVGEVRVAVGGELLFASPGATAFESAHVDVEAMIGGPGPFVAEMPLAREEGGVAVTVQRFGECGVVGVVRPSRELAGEEEEEGESSQK